MNVDMHYPESSSTYLNCCSFGRLVPGAEGNGNQLSSLWASHE